VSTGAHGQPGQVALGHPATVDQPCDAGVQALPGGRVRRDARSTSTAARGTRRSSRTAPTRTAGRPPHRTNRTGRTHQGRPARCRPVAAAVPAACPGRTVRSSPGRRRRRTGCHRRCDASRPPRANRRAQSRGRLHHPPRRVAPVERGGRHQVEPVGRQRPLLEGRGDHVGGRHVPPGHRGEVLAQLDRGDVPSARDHRSCRLPDATPDLQHRGPGGTTRARSSYRLTGYDDLARS